MHADVRGRNLLDDEVIVDIADQQVGIKDLGMVYTAPLQKPSRGRAWHPDQPCNQPVANAPFGIMLVQRMFGSFDKSELVITCCVSCVLTCCFLFLLLETYHERLFLQDMLSVLAEHASTAMSRILASPQASLPASELGYPLLESQLAIARAPSYDFVLSVPEI